MIPRHVPPERAPPSPAPEGTRNDDQTTTLDLVDDQKPILPVDVDLASLRLSCSPKPRKFFFFFPTADSRSRAISTAAWPHCSPWLLAPKARSLACSSVLTV